MLVLAVFAAAAVVLGLVLSLRRAASKPSREPNAEADKQWADNFEAASERMDHEIPDP